MAELTEHIELWKIVKTQQYISPNSLFTALEQPIENPDFRTKLLIKEVCQVLAKYSEFSDWISKHPQIQSIFEDPSIIDDKVGFPSLPYRIMEHVPPLDYSIDAFVSKLFSAKQKDRDDLLAVFRSLDKSLIVEQLQKSLLNAKNNWFVVFGEQLPMI